MKKWMLALIAMLFIAEAIYYNVAYDIMILIVTMFVALGLGAFIIKKKPGYDGFFLRMATGFGMLAIILWLYSFFNFHPKSIYWLFSLVIIAKQRKVIGATIAYAFRAARFTYSRRPWFLFLLIIAVLCYLIPAVYPVWQYDALAKHAAIPFQISQGLHWDYNVVEFIGYGDYALLPHLLYSFLLSLGSMKALVLLNMSFSFMVFLMLVRLSQRMIKNKAYPYLLGCIYFTTPLIFVLSTILYIDIVPLFFIMSALLYFRKFDKKIVVANMHNLFFLVGAAFFAKQNAIYLIVPITVVVVYFVWRTFPFWQGLKRLAASFLICIAPFVPVIALIWYKTGNPVFPFMNETFLSPYFPVINFTDPFDKAKLSFSISSLLSIIFHTSRNLELEDGGLGYFLLLVPIAPLMLIFKRNKLVGFFTFICLASYLLSIAMTNNIRYFFGSIIVATLLGAFVISYVCNFLFRNRTINTAVHVALIAVIVVPNMYFIMNPSYYWGVKKEMLKPHESFTMNDNESILTAINRKGVRLLANNDPFRGTFAGSYYTLTWYNMLLTDKLQKSLIDPVELIKSFDYYLIDKRRLVNFEDQMTDKNPKLQGVISKVQENQSHVLYQVSQQTVVIAQEYTEPLQVKVSTPTMLPFMVEGNQYRIDLDVGPAGADNQMGRWQINWLDEQQQYIATSLIPFALGKQRNNYISDIISDIPKNAKSGILYLTSHDEQPITIYGVQLSQQSRSNENIIDQLLAQYNRKWPYVEL